MRISLGAPLTLILCNVCGAQAKEHIHPGTPVRMLPRTLQFILVTQCMFQALTLTMLARHAVLSFGVGGGIGVILLLVAPTFLCRFYLTPQLLRNFVISISIAEVRTPA